MTVSQTFQPITYSGTVFNQVYNYCAEAATYASVYKQTAQAGDAMSMSVYFNYADYRLQVRQFYQDNGTGSLGGLANLMMAQQNGLADSTVWPNHDYMMYVLPTSAAYENAASFKIESYRPIGLYVNPEVRKEQVAVELWQGKTVIAVVDNFENQGIRHVVAIEGMNESGYIFKNSWGRDYGDNGYSVLQYKDSPVFGGMYVIDKFTGIDLSWTATRSEVALWYASILDRCAEKAGLFFWASMLDAGVSKKAVFDAIYNSAEAQLQFGNLSNDDFVKLEYKICTGREARPEDVDFFSDALDNGWTDRDDQFYWMLNFVKNGNDYAQTAQILENKAHVSAYYGITLQGDGNHYSTMASALDGVTHDANTVHAALIGLQDALNIQAI